MSLSGSLEIFDLGSLLRMLTREKRTGKLVLRSRVNTIQIFFYDGSVVYATETQKNNRLGALLKESGYISQSVLDECLALSLKNKERLGKTLVEKGHVSSEALNQFLLKQAENTVYNVLLWDSGEFEYNDAPLNLGGAVEYKLDAADILLGASRRIDAIGIIRKQIPDDAAILKIAGDMDRAGERGRNADEEKILALIDGNRSVRQILDKSGFDDSAAYRRLYSLISSGKVEISLATMTTEELASRAVKTLGEVDPRQFREALDHLGLKRSSSLRVVLVRIFREVLSEEQVAAAAKNQALKINSPEEKNALDKLREENRVPFFREIIELLCRSVAA
ncbi:MAG: DUF4388 domain-containing protein [Desulfosalsimonadaceae bacterium]